MMERSPLPTQCWRSDGMRPDRPARPLAKPGLTALGKSDHAMMSRRRSNAVPISSATVA
jgi:hypothetical protein